MFKKFRVRVTILCLVSVLSCGFMLCACNDDDDDYPVILNDGVVFSAYICDSTYGVKYTVFPHIQFATKQKVTDFKLIGYNVESVDGLPCHSVSFNTSDEMSCTRYGEYYVYINVFEPIVSLNGCVVEYEKLLISDFEVEIDGKRVILHQNYYLSIFEDESAVLDCMAGSLVGNRAEFITSALQAMSDINIKSITFVNDAITLEKGIRNGTDISVDELLSYCPDTLNADENFTFSFECKLKDNVLAGSGYFVVEYSLVGDDSTTLKSPFGFMYFDYNRDMRAEELLN